MDSQQGDVTTASEDWSSDMYPLFEDDSNSSCGSLDMAMQRVRRDESGENDLEEEKVCAVCGDKANGYHFHALTCEGCKGFFRRSISKGLSFNCPFTRTCPINKAKRRRCQACRLQKCLDVGMKKDMIMTDEALMMRRQLRSKKKQERLKQVQQVAEVGSLTQEQKEMICTLIEAHNKFFDSNFSQFVNYRPQFRIQKFSLDNAAIPSPHCLSPGSLSPALNNVQSLEMSQEGQQLTESVLLSGVFRALPHFADLSTYMIKQVIKFAKAIPAFRALPIDDQISLLKGSTMEVCQIQFNTVFNLETHQWECGKIKISIEDGAVSGFQNLFLEPLQKFHITFRKLNLHESEYVLMEALALFSPDRPGITERDTIDEIQEKTALTLKCYIDYHHPLPEGRFLYPKLLALLTELRTLNEENTRQLLHIQDLNADAMTPLMKEFLS
ncbi:nuclear receptor subfamily 1 group I member 3 [Pelodytes ibericus]